MARNEWINGYLEAILDAGGKKLEGSGRDDEGNGGAMAAAATLVPRLKFSPTKYFVEEVVNSFDEADLHRTWIKAIATRNSTRERSHRLENICWRIWHLARKKKQVESEAARGLARRRLEREEGRRDASEDVSELSEGEKSKEPQKEKITLPRIGSDVPAWLEEEEEEDSSRHLYIVLISLHGLVRGENMELGRDSDTGGQVKYVVELARALAATKGVYRVDLLTRQISSPDVDYSYGEPVEMLRRPPNSDSAADGCGAYIIRLPCGPQQKYLAKESLWPHIPEFVDRAIAHIVDVGRALGEHLEGGMRPVPPYVIHGHYADAGEVAARLAGALDAPMALTGHSLGRNKFEQLLKQGRLSREGIDAAYKIARRVEAEELGLDAAEVVVASTRQEVEEQWGLYDGFDVRLERKLRIRRKRGVSCLGRHMPRMVVIPPGMDFSYVNERDGSDSEGDLKLLVGEDTTTTQGRRKLPPIWSEVMRFFTNPHKPMILALSRPDPKKNVTTLIRAFGESRHLRELANMTLILGNRDDVEEMSGSSSTVLTSVLKLIDKYDLYGQVAYPKHHKQSDVPEIYRLAAKTKGVFINPALVEPFGLTLIEAAAYGLPVVATKNGGPVDILKALNNGLLVDPHDHLAISEALLKLVADKGLWQDCRKNGLKNISRFSWPEHCRHYLAHVERCRTRHPATSSLLGGGGGGAARRMIPEEPMSESLKGLEEDLSIWRLSLSVEGGNNDDTTAALLDAVRQLHRQRDQGNSTPNGKTIGPNPTPNGKSFGGAGYSPGRRQWLIVVAVDRYDANGRLDLEPLWQVIKQVMSLTGSGPGGGAVGLVLSTGSTAEEAVEALGRCRAAASDFDALVCSSGAEVCFPWKGPSPSGADEEYAAHVDYRWPGEHVKSAVPRLAKAGDEDAGLVVEGGAGHSGSHCYAYSLKKGSKARKVDDLRQRLRMRGFRCNLVYTRACTRLNVVPLFASRANALRYLWIKWGVELPKMVVLVGEKGDTDREELLRGLHKTVVLEGAVQSGSEGLLRGEDSYKREDVVDAGSPNVVSVGEGFGFEEVSSALQGLGMMKVSVVVPRRAQLPCI